MIEVEPRLLHGEVSAERNQEEMEDPIRSIAEQDTLGVGVGEPLVPHGRLPESLGVVATAGNAGDHQRDNLRGLELWGHQKATLPRTHPSRGVVSLPRCNSLTSSKPAQSFRSGS